MRILETYGPKIEPIELPLKILVGLCKMLVTRQVYDFFKKSKETSQFVECFESAVSDIVWFFTHTKEGLSSGIPEKELQNIKMYYACELSGVIG